MKRGYLNKDFELFYLKDKRIMEFELHYHDFNKIIIFISGNVTYLIEGRAYKLKPWDILLVSSSDIHKAIIGTSGTYERMIVWVNSNFLHKHNSPDWNLLKCFDIASSEKRNLLRLSPDVLKQGKHILFQLKEECQVNGFGSQVLKNSLFLQFIVYLNRLYLEPVSTEHKADGDYDESIEDLIEREFNTILQETTP